jgi:alkaline phosphatase
MFEKNKSMTFVGNMFPVSAKSVTRSLSVMKGEAGYTDSAASATAMSTGVKTLNKHLGVDENGATLLNIRELAFEMGAKTAVITTDIVTGATPSAYLVHHNSRHDTEIIQAQIDALLASNKIDYLAAEVGNELTNKVAEALALISKDSSFFIMIEEAMIDKTSEKQDIWGTIGNVTRFNDAIAYASQFVMCHPDVALIVTADHETGKLTPYPALGPGFMFESYSHTNTNVPVYALGAGVSVLNDKKLENTELAQFSAKAFTNEEFGASYEPAE